MELDITRFFNEACPMDYSASRAELGQDAGKITWSAAVEDAAEYDILPDDEARDAFRDHVRGFGAWSADEICAWSNDELNARDWAEYQRIAEEGQISSRMWQGDDGRVYYYLGN